MSVNKVRRYLYKTVRIMGDVNAVQKGRAGKRATRRITGKGTGRMLRKLFK